VALLRLAAIVAADHEGGLHHSSDPGDDYLLALAADEHAVLGSGDHHLLQLAGELPIQTARTFLDTLADA
jgi:predicted nucleic acid-binding protein